MKKVIWLTNLPSPYRVEFFNQLGKFVDLVVIFENSKSENRNINWFNYDFKNFRGIFLEDNYFRSVRKIKKVLMQEKYDVAFNSDYSSCLGMYYYLICKKKTIKLVLEADGGIPKNRGTLDIIISLIMKTYSFYFSSGKFTDLYFKYYGVDESKITHYSFTSLTEKEIQMNSTNKLKMKKDTLNLLSIGQPIYRKGFDILIKAIGILDFDLTLDIIGGNPSLEVKELIDENNERIYFHDFMSKEELKTYFQTADLFILPSREEIWGLVINEAISFNLPIITSDNCVSGKEFCSQANVGLIFDNENYVDLAEKIKKLCLNDDLRYNLSNNCQYINKKYTIENMVKEHMIFINEL